VISTRGSDAQSTPTGFLRPRLDGRVTSFFEWSGAARYAVSQDRGVMDLPAKRVIERTFFGFDRNTFYLRVDAPASMADTLDPDMSIRVIFLRPSEAVLTIRRPSEGRVETTFRSGGDAEAEPTIEAALDRVLELAVPFSVLDCQVDDEVLFSLEVHHDDRPSERVPRSGALAFRVPGRTFEEENWTV
jgi:hypothetical protein